MSDPRPIVRASIDAARKTPRAEVYSERRFFTLTGQRLAGTPAAIAEAQAAVDALLAELPRTKHAATVDKHTPTSMPPPSRRSRAGSIEPIAID